MAVEGVDAMVVDLEVDLQVALKELMVVVLMLVEKVEGMAVELLMEEKVVQVEEDDSGGGLQHTASPWLVVEGEEEEEEVVVRATDDCNASWKTT